jgi:hypothetical protein
MYTSHNLYPKVIGSSVENILYLLNEFWKDKLYLQSIFLRNNMFKSFQMFKMRTIHNMHLIRSKRRYNNLATVIKLWTGGIPRVGRRFCGVFCGTRHRGRFDVTFGSCISTSRTRIRYSQRTKPDYQCIANINSKLSSYHQ